MKDIILKTIPLFVVAALSGLLITNLDKITSPIIEQNEIERKNELYSELYEFDDYESIELLENEKAKVEEIVLLYNEDNDIVAYVYEVYGRNVHGSIKLLVCIDTNDVIVDIKYVKLNQTSTYQAAIRDFKDKFSNKKEEDLGDIDTKTGSTMGCELVLDLVNKAIEVHGGRQYE